jgi:hypothetical protein
MRPVLEREFPLPDLVARSKAVARMMKEGLVSFRQRGSRWLWQLRIWRCDRRLSAHSVGRSTATASTS